MPQIQTRQQPVTQITIIESEPHKQQEALSLMTERAQFMARQPGFVSISLHRSLDGATYRELRAVAECRSPACSASIAGIPQGMAPV